MTYTFASAAVDPLNIVLIVLVVVAIWAVAELALVFRRARKTVDEIGKSANETIEQVQPIISKVDGMVDDLQPSIKQVNPLIEKAQSTVDVATVDLARVNDILADVSEVSGTAANVTGVVNKVADSATAGVSSVISHITGKPKGAAPARIAEHRDEPARPSEDAPQARAEASEADGQPEGGYVDYGSMSVSEPAASATPDGAASSQE